MYRQLVLDEWWTDRMGATEADGRLPGRGFLGSYTISVTHDGRTVSTDVELTNGENEIRVVWPHSDG